MAFPQHLRVEILRQMPSLPTMLSSASQRLSRSSGCEKYPQNEIKNGELTYHQKMMQGIEVYREGAGQAPSADTTRALFAMNLEKVSGDLDGMGASSRSGEGIQIVISSAGTEDGNLIASKAFCLLTYTQKIELRTGSVRTKD